ASTLEKGIVSVAAKKGMKISVNRVASLLTIFFTGQPVGNYESARQADTALFARFFHQLLAQGIYWPSSQFEAAFVSLAHSDADVGLTLKAIDRALASLNSSV
ncbi:MAG: hemL, partial [Dehalococcoidales bacterium]|nr:hemL [Dehalococcoidales bacterium]